MKRWETYAMYALVSTILAAETTPIFVLYAARAGTGLPRLITRFLKMRQGIVFISFDN
jgi:hypothetical protein